MKILAISLTNFASYPELSMDLENIGLAAITGPTGAGKSTAMDAISWLLYGITSKDAANDDVKAWGATEPTEGHIIVETPKGTLWVFRERGPRNDLFWLEDGTEDEVRGKDLKDTQRLLDTRLGCDASLFLLGSYLTQFSDADKFFIAKAKDRREVLEQIADQDFPISLGGKASESRKVAKKELEALDLQIAKLDGKIENLVRSVDSSRYAEIEWEETRTHRLVEIANKYESFAATNAKHVAAWLEAQSQKIRRLQVSMANEILQITPPEELVNAKKLIRYKIEACADSECVTCGAPGDNAERMKLAQELSQLEATYLASAQAKTRLSGLEMDLYRLEQERNPHHKRPNPYGEQIATLKAEANPYTRQLEKAKADHVDACAEHIMITTVSIAKEEFIAKLTWLYDKSFEMRALLMAQVVSQVEASTNSYLEAYFDAPIRVKFVLEDSDKLEVEITNNGHSCGFRSLSGGERTQLKLCFALSLMCAAQDKAGVSFGQLFLDEPFQGLSEDLKVKAFRLLEQLSTEYGSVMVIDHSPEMINLFHKTYTVEKDADGHSTIHESTP